MHDTTFLLIKPACAAVADSSGDSPRDAPRQFAANAAIDAATTAARRAASTARIRATHAARQLRRAERAALEAAYDLGAVKTGSDYERFVANILTGAGIPTVRVGQSGDYGADLLANTATGTAVIQCKFYAHPVGYDAVKEAYTAKDIYHAAAAFVVSNAAFTTQARKAARQLGVTLANHAEIAALLKPCQ